MLVGEFIRFEGHQSDMLEYQIKKLDVPVDKANCTASHIWGKELDKYFDCRYYDKQNKPALGTMFVACAGKTKKSF